MGNGPVGCWCVSKETLVLFTFPMIRESNSGERIRELLGLVGPRPSVATRAVSREAAKRWEFKQARRDHAAYSFAGRRVDIDRRTAPAPYCAWRRTLLGSKVRSAGKTSVLF